MFVRLYSCFRGPLLKEQSDTKLVRYYTTSILWKKLFVLVIFVKKPHAGTTQAFSNTHATNNIHYLCLIG